jgi:hypothetical protein
VTENHGVGSSILPLGTMFLRNINLRGETTSRRVVREAS